MTLREQLWELDELTPRSVLNPFHVMQVEKLETSPPSGMRKPPLAAVSAG